MEQNRLNDIIKALQDREVNKPCARCGKSAFDVVGETMIPLNDDPRVIRLPGPSIPAIMLACKSCGDITFHAQGPLNLVRRTS